MNSNFTFRMLVNKYSQMSKDERIKVLNEKKNNIDNISNEEKKTLEIGEDVWNFLNEYSGPLSKVIADWEIYHIAGESSKIPYRYNDQYYNNYKLNRPKEILIELCYHIETIKALIPDIRSKNKSVSRDSFTFVRDRLKKFLERIEMISLEIEFPDEWIKIINLSKKLSNYIYSSYYNILEHEIDELYGLVTELGHILENIKSRL